MSISDDLSVFCRQIRERSEENRTAVVQLRPARTYGAIVGILRQELDSLVRVIYVLAAASRARRASLVSDAVSGRRWKRESGKGIVTDGEMVDIADSLHGWTRSVYKFGCAFIHLSSFHDYNHRDPLAQIPASERAAILEHMRYYHGGPAAENPTFEELAFFLPSVFEKIASNLEHYVRELEAGRDLSDG